MRKTEEVSISFESVEVEEKKKKSIWPSVYSWLDTIVTSLLLIFIAFTFLFRIVGVTGQSMFPTLDNGDVLMVSPTSKEIERGDIVVVTQFDKPLVKRVIAKAGDEINIDVENNVYINGVMLQEPYIIGKTLRYNGFSYPVVVPEGCLFVMGDNREDSSDSRMKEYKFIDERYVLGVVNARVFPLGEWKIDNYENK